MSEQHIHLHQRCEPDGLRWLVLAQRSSSRNHEPVLNRYLRGVADDDLYILTYTKPSSDLRKLNNRSSFNNKQLLASSSSLQPNEREFFLPDCKQMI
jgi:hypothetical protein